MHEAVARRDFEKAAKLRDAWTEVTFLHEYL